MPAPQPRTKDQRAGNQDGGWENKDEGLRTTDCGLHGGGCTRWRRMHGCIRKAFTPTPRQSRTREKEKDPAHIYICTYKNPWRGRAIRRIWPGCVPPHKIDFHFDSLASERIKRVPRNAKIYPVTLLEEPTCLYNLRKGIELCCFQRNWIFSTQIARLILLHFAVFLAIGKVQLAVPTRLPRKRIN